MIDVELHDDNFLQGNTSTRSSLYTSDSAAFTINKNEIRTQAKRTVYDGLHHRHHNEFRVILESNCFGKARDQKAQSWKGEKRVTINKLSLQVLRRAD